MTMSTPEEAEKAARCVQFGGLSVSRDKGVGPRNLKLLVVFGAFMVLWWFG